MKAGMMTDLDTVRTTGNIGIWNILMYSDTDGGKVTVGRCYQLIEMQYCPSPNQKKIVIWALDIDDSAFYRNTKRQCLCLTSSIEKGVYFGLRSPLIYEILHYDDSRRQHQNGLVVPRAFTKWYTGSC